MNARTPLSLAPGRRAASLAALALVGFLPQGLRAKETPPAAPVVHLPEFRVATSAILPSPESWRYARMPTFEILSSLSDSETRRIMNDFLRFHQAMEFVWPSTTPFTELRGSIILCANRKQQASLLPLTDRNEGTITLFLKDRESAAIAIDVGFNPLPHSIRSDAIQSEADTVSREIRTDYAYWVMKQMDPNAPAWLRTGLTELFAEMYYSPTEITFGRLDDLSPIATGASYAPSAGWEDLSHAAMGFHTFEQPWTFPYEPKAPSITEIQDPYAPMSAAFNYYLAHFPIPSLSHLFAMDHGEGPHEGIQAAEAAGFVYLGLYSWNGKYQKDFLQFVQLASQQPVTEDLFESCFHMSFNQMRGLLRDLCTGGVEKFEVLRPENGKFPEPLPINLRAATQSEVGRIKGEAQRMAGHPDEAFWTLIAPYVRGEHDPELLAAIGIDEIAKGDPSGGREFLQAAVDEHSQRGLAYLDLAEWKAQSGKRTQAKALVAQGLPVTNDSDTKARLEKLQAFLSGNPDPAK